MGGGKVKTYHRDDLGLDNRGDGNQLQVEHEVKL